MHKPEEDLELESAKGSALRSATNSGTLDADPVLREFLNSFGEPSWLADDDIDIEVPAWLEAADAPGSVELPQQAGEQTFSLASEALADLATMENAVRRADGVTVIAEPVALEDEFPDEPEWTSEAAPAAAPQSSEQADASLQSIVDEIDAQMAYAAAPASHEEEARVDTATAQHVVFYLGTTRYSLPIEAVIEVSTVPRITTLPGIPHYVRGVANLRGEILPVLDMRGLLGLPRISNTVLERMLVVRFAEQDAVVGLVVDRIRGLARLDETRVMHPQGLAEDAVLRFLEGVTEHENEVLNVLNARKIFHSEELRRLAGN
jgi:purine-binding chemotaxis protein CheW